MRAKLLLIVVYFFGIASLHAQKNQIPLIGGDAPNFTAQTTNGVLNFPSDYGKSWKILFSHPRDFTPVCSSEILRLAHMQKDFSDLNVKIAIISTDKLDKHQQWKSALEAVNYRGEAPTKIDFPLIDDNNYNVSKEYGMLHDPASDSEDVRGVFIIDPNNKVRAIYFYPMNIGRNMQEIKRTVIALQKTENNKNEVVVCPENWNPGDDLMVPHFPYTQKELADDPKIKDQYYSVSSFMWYKKSN